MSKNPKSIEMVRLIAHAFGDLNDSAVFVGGSTIPLYVSEQYWSQVRPTEDVDVVLGVIGKIKNWKTDDLLKTKGFQNDMSQGAPICRWVYNGLKVDIMTTDESVFGFTNMWYKEGVEKAIKVSLGSVQVQIFSVPYFLATKIEAFKGRGRKDFQGSPDMEDIISVLEVSNQISPQLFSSASSGLKKYLKSELNALIKNQDFIDALPGAVFNRINTGQGVKAVIEQIDRIRFLLTQSR